MIGTQFKKGVLNMLVLALLKKRAFYGYELVQKISQTIQISEGTIYPLLRRLKKDNLVTTYLEESEQGAPRKYYKLTNKGEQSLKEFLQEWNDFYKDVNKLLEQTR
jgi:PadR family transcriptional regulator PadR